MGRFGTIHAVNDCLRIVERGRRDMATVLSDFVINDDDDVGIMGDLNFPYANEILPEHHVEDIDLLWTAIQTLRLTQVVLSEETT